MSKAARRLRTALAGLAFATTAAATAFTLTPGSIVTIDGNSQAIRAYDFTGNLLDTLPLPFPIDNPSGLTIVGTSVYVLDDNGSVGRVNLSDGLVTPVLQVNGNVALGDNGTNLLVADLGTGVVSEYSTAGALLRTIVTLGFITGLDGDEGSFYAGTYSNGHILQYDYTGKLLNTIVTGVGAGSISALGFDSGTGTIWVASGFGDGKIRQFTKTGKLLSQFTPGPFITGLDIVRRKRN